MIFHHLITNAYQAMKEKGERLTITTRPLKDGIEIKVSDEGMGIPSCDLPHLFEPFFTTRPVGEGKGLGLNIVYRIITKYDGAIRVESKEQMGTTFIIQFPTRRGS